LALPAQRVPMESSAVKDLRVRLGKLDIQERLGRPVREETREVPGHRVASERRDSPAQRGWMALQVQRVLRVQLVLPDSRGLRDWMARLDLLECPDWPASLERLGQPERLELPGIRVRRDQRAALAIRESQVHRGLRVYRE